jgi:quinoprotein dehydrogenase-associated probable ABC transporter substrate-binding protein
MSLHSHETCEGAYNSRRRVRVAGGLCLLLFAVMVSGSEAQPLPQRQLRVCADPNNLPFSNERLEGFENKLAALIAQELHATLTYTWWAQRRGFIRNTLKAATCDLLMGVPKRLDAVLTTSPYYRSTYVFVYRQAAGPPVHSLDDPLLRTVKIGVQLIGNDGANSPSAHALARRHIIENVVGYSVYGDYAQPNPTAQIIEAVATGAVDVAVVWGPIASYFARSQSVPLTVVPATPSRDGPALPFVFEIALGVRRGEEAFRAELEDILQRRRPEINRILDAYGVPRVETSEPRSAAQ